MIPIYEKEKAVSGLAEKIRANSSVAYNPQIIPWQPASTDSYIDRTAVAESFTMHTKGSVNDRDLYFTKSILVSTNWNKNDDVFGREPVWAARHTPSHKPTNIEHDEKRLVGHITDTWALDTSGNFIPDDTVIDQLPDLYHIANGAVIYTAWEDDKLIARTEDLISKIEANEMFVSMEALFRNFAYAVVTPEKEFFIVARNSDSAFLTKHLRSYGGNGLFDGCQVGRLLLDITFSGKGYVEHAANPYSEIFNETNPFVFSKASLKNPFERLSGVSINYTSSSKSDDKMENTNNMTEANELLQSQNVKLEARVQELQTKLEELTQSSSKAGIEKLETTVADLKTRLEAAEKAQQDSSAKVEELTAAKDKVEAELKTVSEAKEALEKEVAEAKDLQVKSSRISKLVEGGVERKSAEAKVEIYANLTDEQFDAVASDIITVAEFMKNKDKQDDKNKNGKDGKKKDDKSSASDDDVDPADENADAGALDNVEEEETPDMSSDASTDEDDKLTLAKELRQALASRFDYDEEEDDS